MNNEPVAWMNPNESSLDYKFSDECAGDWNIPLYTHLVKELDEQFEKGFKAGKEEGWKAHKFHHPVKEQDESFDRTASHMAGEYVSYPVKEQDTECQYCKQGCIRCDARKQLTDEEMKDLIQEYWGDVHIVDPDGYLHEIAFIRAILRKAQEK